MRRRLTDARAGSRTDHQQSCDPGRAPRGGEGIRGVRDYEEVAAAHARITLEQDDATDWAGVVQRDFRESWGVQGNREIAWVIDLDQPV
jgi:hypothetical protein